MIIRPLLLASLCLTLVNSADAASTLMGVVYGCASASLRRVIVPDDDKQLTAQNWIMRGECFLIVPQTDDITADIMKATGKQPIQPRAINSLTGEIIAADPDIDTVAGAVLRSAPVDPLPALELQDLQP